MGSRLLSIIERNWQHLVREGQVLSFCRGQVLFYEGHMPYGVFVLLRGRVEFNKQELPSGDNHVTPFPRGDLIGLESFFEKNPYCCTCQASEDCWVVFISKTQLMPYLKGWAL